MTFRVGQKVTLKDAKPWVTEGYGDEVYPQFGVIYTVRYIESVSEGDFLYLVEIRNPLHDYAEGYDETNFDAREFVPVVKTSIEIFTAMLKPSKVEA